MASTKIKISRDLYERLDATAETLGYSSAEEFAIHLLEQAVAGNDGGTMSEDEVKKRLQGLGYME